jgi:transposase
MKKHILVEHHTLPELIKAKNKTSDEGQKLRLRAIINIKKGKLIHQVAEDLVVTRRSVSTWQNKYNEKGIEGLTTNLGGRPEGNPTWDTEIWTALGKTVKTQGGYWSIPKMQEWIKEKYKKSIPEQTVWYHLDKLGFSYKSARPHPYLGDKEKQTVFKKKWSH